MPVLTQSPNWDSLIQDFPHQEESALPSSLLSGLMANFGGLPPTSQGITSVQQADPFFLTQWGDTSTNAGDPTVDAPEDAPYGHSECVPTSGVMALSALGLIDHPSPEQAAEVIHDLRLDSGNRSSGGMNFGELATGLEKHGAATQDLGTDLTAIDAALESGNPVLAGGNPWEAWGQQMNESGEYLNFSDPGDHAVCILGKNPDSGKYIVADPLSRNGAIEVTREQLERFFADGTDVGAMEVSRADGATGSPKIEPMEGSQGGSESAPSPSKKPPAAPLDSIGDITSPDAWIPVDAPKQNGEGNRSAETYNQVIDQFDVENNPRYAQRDGNTYCNIFAWDVTRAMGAEIPHYRADGSEMNANGVADWLRDQGGEYGWHPVSQQEAQEMANQGKPVVVSWKNEGSIGHIGVVRPGEMGENGPNLAQAGSTNTNNAHVRDEDTFGGVDAIYYAHN